MKLEKGESVFFMKVAYDTISDASTKTIQDVEQVGGYIYITLSNDDYFQIRPFEKDFRIFHNSSGNIHTFMTEDTKDGRKLIKQALKEEIGTIISQIGKLKSRRDDLLTVLDNFRID